MIEIKDVKNIKSAALELCLWNGNTLYVLRLRDNSTNEKYLVLASSDKEGRFNLPIILNEVIKGYKELIPLKLMLTNSELGNLKEYINNTNTVPEAYFYQRFGFSVNSSGEVCFNGSEVVSMEKVKKVKATYESAVDTGYLPVEFIRDRINYKKPKAKEILFKTSDILESKGSLKKSLEFYKATAVESVMQITVAAGFASVLVHLLDCNPILLNLWGKSSTGKTSASLLVTSLYSSPKDARLMLDFDRTLMA
ncbi:MAG TPA: DUF927 domain-containing protein, partial [Clostridium sp.]